MRSVAVLLLLACAMSAFAYDMRYASPNGRYGVVVLYTSHDDPQPPTATAILFDVALGTPLERGRFPIPVQHNRILVSNTGWFCILADEPRLTIYRGDDTPPVKLSAADIFSPNDLHAIATLRARPAYEVTGEYVVATLAPYGSIRIDRNGRLLDEKRDFYPPYRVRTEAAGALPAPWPDCAERGITRVYTDALLVRATSRVLPEYPLIAKKARISGLVIVDVVVNASGEIVCSRVSKPLPFGFDTAAMKAILAWKFVPGDGPLAASIGFRFEEPDVSALR
jgi:TonB family protein